MNDCSTEVKLINLMNDDLMAHGSGIKKGDY